MAKSSNPTLLSLKVTLRGIRPPIWRRLLVLESLTLGQLHHVIQAAMGWGDGHLHAFEIGGDQYGDPAQTDFTASERRLTLAKVVAAGVQRFTYTYDFGDNWEHQLLIEKRRPTAEGVTVPTCIAGQRACPPEDCGGPWGYEHLLEALANPAHPEHEEQKEWIGDEFDPERFDIAAVNARLAARFRRKAAG